MAGFAEDNITNNYNNNNNDNADGNGVMEEWVLRSPSSRSPFMTLLGEDDVCPRPIITEHSADCNTKDRNLYSQGYDGSEIVECKVPGQSDPRHFEEHGGEPIATKPSLSERIAARAGFSSLSLNLDHLRSELYSNSDSSSPFLTISPGLSPATLLDSPVFVANSSVQPSPTTGKYSRMPNETDDVGAAMPTDNFDKNRDAFFEDINFLSFPLKFPSPSSPSFHGVTSEVKPTDLLHQSLPRYEVKSESDDLPKSDSVDSRIATMQNGDKVAYQADPRRSLGENHNELSPSREEHQEEEHRGSGSEDGYNWRKYGQKQVKGSEYPRSYYKCTHPNCAVKKKVERSPEGYVTEIIYKGRHNHEKPPPSRRSAMVSSSNFGSQTVQDGNDNSEIAVGATPELKHDTTVEVTSMGLEQVHYASRFESGDAVVDASSTLSNDDAEGDFATHGSMSLSYDGDEEGPETKRRKLETYAGASRAVREPRIVVQTTSDVDILDDGYRWRKYGQKVVKGNPNPRSYYKCTSAGCTVRKHVERASHDLKSVITTYEGKHNHEVPVARNSGSHSNTGNNATAQTSPIQAPNCQPEPQQIHHNMPRFDRPVSYTPFGFQLTQQLGNTPAFPLGLGQPSFTNLAMATLGSNQPKLPTLPMHAYLPQHPRVNNIGIMLPKGDPKMEPVSEPELPMIHDTSLYEQIMGRLPPEPQL